MAQGGGERAAERYRKPCRTLSAENTGKRLSQFPSTSKLHLSIRLAGVQARMSLYQRAGRAKNNKVKSEFQTFFFLIWVCNLNSLGLRGWGKAVLCGLLHHKFLNLLLKPWLKSDKNRLCFIIMSCSQSMAPITKQYFITFATFNSSH